MLFGYTGRGFDSATGMQNNLDRGYVPGVGRWISEDPIGFAGGDVNLVRFAANNIINFVDPMRLTVYWINRSIGGPKETSPWNPLTHSYIAIRNDDGTVDTYSWGDDNDNGVWFHNAENDLNAAYDAIDKGKAYVIDGGDGLHDEIRNQYEKTKDDYHRKDGWRFTNNCKHRAKRLIRDAHWEQKVNGEK